MILYFTDSINSFSQTSYNKIAFTLQNHTITCPKCGCSCIFSYHARYSRTFHIGGIDITIMVIRLRCSHCHSTHAVLPSFAMPCSRINIEDAVDILVSEDEADTMVRLQISMHQLRSIKERYADYWKQFVPDLSVPISEITQHCIGLLSKQFLQVRNLAVSSVFT
ncbi:MAG: DUF6431 domain-containing protein [Lachnospiraceae bacterium]